MAVNVAALPDDAIDYITTLRQEAAQFRHQRNGARREADRLRESDAGLRHELATLRAQVEALKAELGR